MTLSRSGKVDQWRIRKKKLTKGVDLREREEYCLQKSRLAPSFEGEEEKSKKRERERERVQCLSEPSEIGRSPIKSFGPPFWFFSHKPKATESHMGRSIPILMSKG